jgi:hypothetical protein
MKRHVIWSALLAVALVAAPALRADVKTREKSSVKFEGMMGRFIGMMAGAGEKTDTVALKGTRMARMGTDNGQIIDLTAERIYLVDVKKKEYQVVTFAQMREQMKKLQEDMAKQRQQMSEEDKKALDDAAKSLEFTADVKETGQKKTIAGHETREVIVSIAGHEKGRKIEESGGFVLTTSMWLAPKVAAMDEMNQFNMKFVKAVYGEAFGANAQQMLSVTALFPALKPMMDKMQQERNKLQGTPLASTTTFETVRSPEALKQAQQQQTGGGLGGALARRVMGQKGQPQARSTVLTSNQETLSIETTATEAEVAVPAGFREKK